MLPSSEACDTPEDDDCDGLVNQGCPCEPGEAEPCYTGPAGTQGVGSCKPGTHVCNADGVSFGPCTGDVTPAIETCATPTDEDCDGSNNEEGVGCVCEPDSIVDCYTGPPEAAGIGACSLGTQACNHQGTVLGVCSGSVLPTFDDCLTPADEDCDGAASPCAGTHVWSKSFELAIAPAIATDSDGNVYITGDFLGTVDFGGAPLTSVGPYGSDIFVAKFDSQGGFLWSKRFGGIAYDRATAVATDPSGNLLLAGQFQDVIDFGGGSLTCVGTDDVFVVKLDGAGNEIFSRRFGSIGYQAARLVAADLDGNTILAGEFEGTIDFGGGPLTNVESSDIFVAKLDTTGAHVFSSRFGNSVSVGSPGPAVNGLATDSTGNALLTGAFTSTINFGGGTLTSAGATDAFAVKLSPSGAHVWSKRFGNSASQSGHAVASDDMNNVLLTGSFEGNVDFGGGPMASEGSADVYLAKLDPGGAPLWAKRFGNDFPQLGHGVATDQANSVIVTGSLAGNADFGGGSLTSSGNYDAFVAKLDADGAHLWSHRYGDFDEQRGLRVATSGTGHIILSGQFESTVDFGGGPLSTPNGVDSFLVSLSP